MKNTIRNARLLLLGLGALVAVGCHPKPKATTFAASGYLPSADAITTSNQATLSGLAQTIDGVVLNASGYRVWVVGQTTKTQDGCYLTASVAWTRCDEAQVGTDVAGARFNVRTGGNSGTWTITNPPGSGLVGVNDLTASSGGGGGGGAVSSVFGRTGAVVGASNDYTYDQVGQAVADSTFGDGTKRLIGVGDPTGAQDVLTLNYSRLLRDDNTNVEFNEEWMGCVTATVANNTAITGPGAYLANVTGTAAFFSCGGGATGGFVSTFQCQTGSTTTGLCGFSHGPSTAGFYQWAIASAQELYYSQRIRIEQLSNGTDTYTFNLGFFDGVFVAAPTNFLGFRHLNGQANWQFVSNVAGTPTTVNTGVAVETTSYHRFEILKDFASSTVVGKIDGADVTTSGSGGPVTSFPTAIMTDGAYALNSAGTGTGRKFDSDWVHPRLRWPSSAPRNN